MKKCLLYVNTKNGYILCPIKCDSISDAIRKGKEANGFFFRITDLNGKTIKSGFCKNVEAFI